MYYCHKCKAIYYGEDACAVTIEDEVNSIKRTHRFSVCPNCLKEVANLFMDKEMPVKPEEKGEEN